MADKDKLYERGVFAFVERFPGEVVAGVAVICFPGLALVLPVALGWNAAWLIWANIVGATLAGSVACGWLIVQLRARDRRLLLQ